MGIVLCRVDERLIHGQVTVGWGEYLHVDRYVVVDDDLADAEWEREIYGLGVPAEAKADFLSAGEGRTALAGWRDSSERVIVLTRNLDHMVRLGGAGGFLGERVNLGGIYHAAGRREVLPYLFLSAEDCDRIRLLLDEGIAVTAQDLPSSPEVDGRSLLGA